MRREVRIFFLFWGHFISFLFFLLLCIHIYFAFKDGFWVRVDFFIVILFFGHFHSLFYKFVFYGVSRSLKLFVTPQKLTFVCSGAPDTITVQFGPLKQSF